MTDASSLLAGLKIVHIGAGMAPAIAARLLAKAGATVVRVAPVGDEAFQAVYPAYAAWHADMTIESPDALHRLLAEADLCIVGGEDHPDVVPRAAPAEADFPRLVIVRISGNPGPGPDADCPTNELLAQARSGLVFEHHPDRPLAMSFAPANIGAAVQALVGGLAALFERETSGHGQTIWTSLVEGAQSWLPMFWVEMEKPTPGAAFVTPKHGVPLVFRCADGEYLHFVIGAAGSKYKLYQVLGVDDPTVLPGDSGMPKPGGNPRNFYGDIDTLTDYIARWNRDDLLAALWAAGLAAEPVLAPGGCWDDPQIVRNGVIVKDAEGRRTVGLPFLAQRTHAAQPREIVPGRRPLDGIRVIDFGAYVAGPLSSQLLTGLGADVIKVEPPRGEPSRGLVRGYLAANRGKRGITLDLKSPDDVATAQKLAVTAHVVASNFRSGVSKRLGIDPATLAQRQPDLITLESPAYGSEGPSAERAGFDMVMQAVTGLEHRAGSANHHPMWNRMSMVDFAGGSLGAIAILCGLLARRRGGGGVNLEVPLINAGLFLLSELVQLPDGSFAGAQPVNAAGTGYHPLEALYEAKDGWIAISAGGAVGERKLRAVLDLPEHELQEADIAAAVAKRAASELVTAFRAAGVWAEPCRVDAEQAFFADQRLIDRGTIRIVDHPVFGRMKDFGLFFTMSRSPLGNSIPLHDIGEHNAEVLAELAAS